MAMSVTESSRKSPFVIEWRDSFRVSIPQVDMEHRHLFQLVKELDLATVERTIEELLDYVVMHFSNEQELMERCGYPGFEQHLKLHEQFGNQVAEFLGNGEPWSEARVQTVRRFLNKWLIGHIMTHDLRFGRWYLDRANKPLVEHVSAAPPRRGFLARLLDRRSA
jgi:hemerythrin